MDERRAWGRVARSVAVIIHGRPVPDPATENRLRRLDRLRPDPSLRLACAQRWAPVGFRLAQALHHGTDHRSQICTAPTTLGVEPPHIDVWDFGMDTGRIVEKMPDS